MLPARRRLGNSAATWGEWVATKLRWDLSVDKTDLEALKVLSDGPCENTAVVYTSAP